MICEALIMFYDMFFYVQYWTIVCVLSVITVFCVVLLQHNNE